MWTRAALKAKAKTVLKTSYWKAFLISLLIGVAGGNNGGINFNLGGGNGSGSGNYYFGNGTQFSEFFTSAVLIIIAIVVLVILVLVAGFRIFVGYPLEVGGRRFFVESAEGHTDLNNISFAFGKEKYGNIVKTMLLRSVYTFLWTLLLIIPGIVKGFAYSMVPYILADNPGIGQKRAIQLSNQMTMGHKFNIFVLGLSFIGWYILGTLALLVGTLFVLPYDNATRAELYRVLRENAIISGLCTREELNLQEIAQDLPDMS